MSDAWWRVAGNLWFVVFELKHDNWKIVAVNIFRDIQPLLEDFASKIQQLLPVINMFDPASWYW